MEVGKAEGILHQRRCSVINIRKILYATDFSPYSNQAYFHAIALAEGHGASLAVVHVLSPVVISRSVSPVVSFNPEEREYWRGQLEQIRPVNANIAVQHVLLEGDPGEEIINYATEASLDLIVMGTHGRTGLERLLMGSVAEKVLRGAPCSVLVVKMQKRTKGEEEKAAAAEVGVGPLK
jgi:nucleotide-binding universal stress UspA family protein